MQPDFTPKRRADKDVVSYAEFTGLRNDIAPERFDATDLSIATNVDLDKSRRAKRRAGSTLRLAQPTHSLWAAGALAFCASAGTLYALGADLSTTALRTGLSGDPVSFARVGDAVYFSDGTDTGVIENGSARSWGLETPSVMALPVAGDLPPGRYGFAATYQRGDDQESGTEQSVLATVAAGQSVYLTVPLSVDPGVTATNIYMTTPDGEVLYLAATLTNGATDFTPTADIVMGLNLPLDTQFMGPAPIGQLVAYYRGRMYVAQGNVLFYSEPFAYELFDPRNYIVLDAEITMLAPMEDKTGDASGFFVGTAASCGLITGADPATFEYMALTDYGAVKGALDYVDGALYQDGAAGARPLPMWLSTQGLCVGLPGLTVNNLTRSRYGFSADSTGAALFIPTVNRFIAVSGANPAIVMQIENQTLTSYTNFAYNSFANFGERMLAASAAGLFELVGDTDNGVPIAAEVAFGTTDFGSSYLKVIDRLFIGYRAAQGVTLTVTLEDTSAYSYPAPEAAEGLLSHRVKLGRGLVARYWRFSLTNVGGADFALDTVDVHSAQLGRRMNGRA